MNTQFGTLAAAITNTTLAARAPNFPARTGPEHKLEQLNLNGHSFNDFENNPESN